MNNKRKFDKFDESVQDETLTLKCKKAKHEWGKIKIGYQSFEEFIMVNPLTTEEKKENKDIESKIINLIEKNDDGKYVPEIQYYSNYPYFKRPFQFVQVAKDEIDEIIKAYKFFKNLKSLLLQYNYIKEF